jgi:hypothetical protein
MEKKLPQLSQFPREGGKVPTLSMLLIRIIRLGMLGLIYFYLIRSKKVLFIVPAPHSLLGSCNTYYNVVCCGNHMKL